MLRRGDYVLCNFPFRESRGPGPSPHIVLCAATGRQGNTRFAIVFYTTSRTEYQGARRPRQYLFVSQARAMELGQKVAFQIDASRIVSKSQELIRSRGDRIGFRIETPQ